MDAERVEPDNNENQWHTCCGKTSDSRLLTFVASLSISLLILIFCAYKLSEEMDCPSENTYIGLTSLIIGVWIKSPVQ